MSLPSRINYSNRSSGHRYLVLRGEIMEILGGDLSECMVLTALIQWDTYKRNDNDYRDADDNQILELSKAKILETCLGGISQRTVTNCIARLEERGFITYQAPSSIGWKGRFTVQAAAINRAILGLSPVRVLPQANLPTGEEFQEFTPASEGTEELIAAGKFAHGPQANLLTAAGKFAHVPQANLPAYKEELTEESKQAEQTERVNSASHHVSIETSADVGTTPEESVTLHGIFSPKAPSPLDPATLVHVWNRSRGVKKLNKSDASSFQEAVGKWDCGQDEAEAALGRFVADAYWKEQGLPWRAFTKNIEKYLRDDEPVTASTVVGAAAVDSARPVCSGDLRRPVDTGNRPSPSPSALPWPVSRWNELVPAGHKVVAWDISSSIAKSLADAMNNQAFVDQYDTLCRKCQAIAEADPTMVSFSWAMKGNKWVGVLNGDWDWLVTKAKGGSAAKTAAPSAADRLLAAMETK